MVRSTNVSFFTAREHPPLTPWKTLQKSIDIFSYNHSVICDCSVIMFCINMYRYFYKRKFSEKCILYCWNIAFFITYIITHRQYLRNGNEFLIKKILFLDSNMNTTVFFISAITVIQNSCCCTWIIDSWLWYVGYKCLYSGSCLLCCIKRYWSIMYIINGTCEYVPYQYNVWYNIQSIWCVIVFCWSTIPHIDHLSLNIHHNDYWCQISTV